jgi:hypothetical protein
MHLSILPDNVMRIILFLWQACSQYGTLERECSWKHRSRDCYTHRNTASLRFQGSVRSERIRVFLHTSYTAIPGTPDHLLGKLTGIIR